MKKLSEVFRMRIYSDQAHHVGSVQDVVIDDKQGKITGLVFSREEGKAISIPFSTVMAIGDIVLVSSKKAE